MEKNHGKEGKEPYMKPGQDIVMVGYIALQGTVMAAEKKEAVLLKTLPQDLLDTARGFTKYLELESVLDEYCDVIAMQQVEEGGVFAALWNMAEQYQVGLTVYLKKIPVRQETIEICEVLDLNPYELLSGGCVLLAADNGNDVICKLEGKGIPVVFIGKVTDSNDRIILNGENCRYINRPEPDEVRKLCQGF